MKKLILLFAVAVLATSCMEYKPAQTTSTEGNGFAVEYLFTKDSVKVYRFRDGGRTHYFTTRGETITTQKSGKNSRRPENIQ
jgi:hypothetical protein